MYTARDRRGFQRVASGAGGLLRDGFLRVWEAVDARVAELAAQPSMRGRLKMLGVHLLFVARQARGAIRRGDNVGFVRRPARPRAKTD
jgi:hypothetical protein